ncbi:MAG TPA: hypothetical protein V6C46_02040 [Coleofasciculaceae cyanobacterium]
MQGVKEMKISKQTQKELIGFAATWGIALLTGNVRDLDALEVSLEKLLEVVQKEKALAKSS